MKDFKHYFEEAEEDLMNPEVSGETPAEEQPAAPAPEEEMEKPEGNSEPVGIKLKDTVFIDANGQLVVQLATSKKQLSPDEYLNKYLPALLTKAEYEGK